MKILLTALAVCAISAASAFASSQSATENWVRSYIATNAASTSSPKVATVTASQIVDGTNVTVSMTAFFSSEPSWMIVESTVPGMAVGTHFAIDEYGNACNYTNTACTFIYQSVSTNWTFVTGGVTNVRNVVQLDFRVGGDDYRGWEDYRFREATAAGVSNDVGYVRFRRSYVLPSVRRKLLTPPNQVSWLDIILPRARAEWVPSDWELDPEVSPNPYDGNDGYVYSDWISHYIWEGEALDIEIPSVQVEFANGSVYNFNVNVSDRLDVESDYCDRKNFDVDKAFEKLNSLIDEGARESMGEESATYKLFKTILDKGSFDKQLKTALENALTPYLLADLSCPQRYTTSEKIAEEGEEQKPPAKPSSVIAPFGTCNHKSVYSDGNELVCQFRCRSCKKLLASYEHAWEDGEKTCAKCNRTFRNVTCGKTSMKRELHEFGREYGGTSDGCYCKHHHLWAPHPENRLILVSGDWLFDENGHWRKYECGVCGYNPIIRDRDSHEKWMMYDKGPYCYPDRCETSNICYKCGYAVLGKVFPGHVDPGVHYHEKIDEDVHSTYFTCSKCRWRIYLEDDPHVPDGRYRVCQDDGDGGHKVFLQCSNTNGCGKVYLSGIEPHAPGDPNGLYETCVESNSYHFVLCKCKAVKNGCTHIVRGDLRNCEKIGIGQQIVLVDDVNKKDYYPCRLCPNGHAEEVPHSWFYNDEEHWCENDQNNHHLNGAHTLVDNVCSVCGFTPLGEPEERPTEWDNRDPLKITNEYITVTYYRGFANYWVRGIDFSDPVLEIGDWCFREAFISMPNLLYSNMSTVRTVGEGAFYEAFTNCARLAQVDFRSLSSAGESAFRGAFVGCKMNELVEFGSLRTCGLACFEGAFESTRVTSLSFKSLVDPNGDLNFFCGTPCETLVWLGAPKLDFSMSGSAFVFNFTDMPNLQTLDLSGVSTNVANRIGDLSSLARLRRLDFHKMTGIPSYWQPGATSDVHAPTNNPDCMIVVPDELCEAWRAAPGWSNVWRQIVPYSNQVIRAAVTVSFDTDWGEPIPPSVITKGAAFDAPTNTYRYAASVGGADDGAYVLDGWYLDDARTVPFTNGVSVVSNTTLHAKWRDASEMSCSLSAAGSEFGYNCVGSFGGRIGFADWNGVVRMYYTVTDSGATVTNSCLPTFYMDYGDMAAVIPSSVPQSAFPLSAWLKVECADPNCRTCSEEFEINLNTNE